MQTEISWMFYVCDIFFPNLEWQTSLFWGTFNDSFCNIGYVMFRFVKVVIKGCIKVCSLWWHQKKGAGKSGEKKKKSSESDKSVGTLTTHWQYFISYEKWYSKSWLFNVDLHAFSIW